MLRRLAAALVASSVTGCIANSPPAAIPPAPRDYWVAAPVEKVWAAAVQAVADNGAPIAAMDKQSGFLRTGDLRLTMQQAQQWLDCGRDGQGVPFTSTGLVSYFVSYTLLVRGEGDSTAIRPQVSGGAWNSTDARLMARGNMFAQNPNLYCVSLGVLEQVLVTSTAARAGAPLGNAAGPVLRQVEAPFVREEWGRVIEVARRSLLDLGATDLSEPVVGEVTARLFLDRTSGTGVADCGRNDAGQPLAPNSARYRVRVDGATGGSTFRIEATPYPSPQCQSNGVLEDRLQQRMLSALARRP